MIWKLLKGLLYENTEQLPDDLEVFKKEATHDQWRKDRKQKYSDCSG